MAGTVEKAAYRAKGLWEGNIQKEQQNDMEKNNIDRN